MGNNELSLSEEIATNILERGKNSQKTQEAADALYEVLHANLDGKIFDKVDSLVGAYLAASVTDAIKSAFVTGIQYVAE